MIFAIYEDDGPKGICGQDCETTSNWHRLYIFDNEEQFKSFKERVVERGFRKNSRIIDMFDSEQMYSGRGVYHMVNNKLNNLRYMEVTFHNRQY